MLQIGGGVNELVRVGVGFTVMVNVLTVPVHPLAEGVTVMVATTGNAVTLVAMNDGIFPDPLAGNPIEGVLLVQVKVVPATGPLKMMGVVAVPLQ